MTNEVRNSRFRYVDADNLENASVDLSDLDVRNTAGEKVGEVDGFIVDAATERPYYVVVSSGGWFSGGKCLLPINHTRLERDRKNDEDVLRADLDKETIKRYPKFEKDEFAQLSDEQLRVFETRIVEVCCPGEIAEGTGGTRTVTYENLQHYRQPEWWSRSVQAPTATPHVPPERAIPTAPPSHAAEPERERVVAREDQPVGNRAEPGDVLGIESGGEETHLGKTAQDERRRVQISDRETRQAEKNERG